MATPDIPMLLSRKSQDALLEYTKQCYMFVDQSWNLRERLRKIDKAYYREKDLSAEQTKAKLSNTYGDPSKFQNITVPVVLPQVESAVTYQSSVFLTGHPLFAVVAAPQYMNAAMQLESVIDNQATRGGWVAEIEMFFRNGFKYNLAAMEVSWCQELIPSFETDIKFKDGQEGKVKELLWAGNKLRNLDLYNTFFDTRVVPSLVPEQGEFAGYTELMSRIRLKQFISSLPTKFIDNIRPAFESGYGTPSNDGVESYYIPDINNQIRIGKDPKAGNFNWMSWAELAGSDQKIQYKDSYEVTTLYARILPSEFNIKVPSSNTPQVWKLIIVNHSVLIHAERQTNAHGLLPILFAQPLEDGLGYQTKSLSENVEPMQDITSAMWNSIIAARRRAISDRGIYDPSRLSEKHINSDNPSAKIPVRPAAYGKPVGESYFPIPFRDDQSGILMQETQSVIQMADMISGRNQVRQGQFVKGNKTRKEFETVMGNANGRDQLTSLHYEAQFFTPLKEILKVNILQYQGAESLYSEPAKRMVTIDPLVLRQAVMNFKLADGLLPTDKLVNADVLQVAMQVIGSSPQIGQGYNIAPMFSYLMKTQGADLSPFEKSPEQLAYEQALAQWQQVMMQITEQLVKTGQDLSTVKWPPQPMPQQFNYTPTGNNVAQQPIGAPQGDTNGQYQT